MYDWSMPQWCNLFERLLHPGENVAASAGNSLEAVKSLRAAITKFVLLTASPGYHNKV